MYLTMEPKERVDSMSFNPRQPGALLGAGGVPIPQPSNYKCPVCGDRPMLAQAPGLPVGMPVCNITKLPTETEPEFGCVNCWNIFSVKMMRRHSPKLIKITVLDITGGDSAAEADPA